jgi:two-component system, NtrC family, response regulator AtoC
MDRPMQEIAPEAMRHLVEYDYPGNVRELSHFIERGVALAQGEVLGAEHLPQHLGKLTLCVFAPELAPLEAQEKAHILHG